MRPFDDVKALLKPALAQSLQLLEWVWPTQTLRPIRSGKTPVRAIPLLEVR